MTKLRRIQVFPASLLILIAALYGFGQTPADRHQRIRADIDTGDLKKALDEVRAIRAANTELFQANNFDYLQARLAQLNGNSGEAASAYES
ncbi:MAG: hypothetical protein C5B44_00855, partial [Acidobacteria bacterium]